MKTNTLNTDFVLRWIGSSAMAILLTATILIAVMSPDGHAKEQNQEKANSNHFRIFIYPEMLTNKDTLLVHGKGSNPITLESNTSLIWVDREPDFRFGHATEFILVSQTGTKLIKGSWWAILNGKDLFRDGKPRSIEDKAVRGLKSFLPMHH